MAAHDAAPSHGRDAIASAKARTPPHWCGAEAGGLIADNDRRDVVMRAVPERGFDEQPREALARRRPRVTAFRELAARLRRVARVDQKRGRQIGRYHVPDSVAANHEQLVACSAPPRAYLGPRGHALRTRPEPRGALELKVAERAAQVQHAVDTAEHDAPARRNDARMLVGVGWLVVSRERDRRRSRAGRGIRAHRESRAPPAARDMSGAAPEHHAAVAGVGHDDVGRRDDGNACGRSRAVVTRRAQALVEVDERMLQRSA